MRFRALLVGTVIASSVVMVPAAAAHRRHHRRHRCPSGRVARRVRVHVRRHHRLVWVRRWKCVRVHHRRRRHPTGTTGPSGPTATVTAPKLSFHTTTDPSFVQSASDPLAVTYSYSADATETSGAQTLDLAQTGQLPDGILNFYSQTAPYSPMALYCSTNVGGSATAASCPITYPTTGTFEVTTQYIPDGASATTSTSWETISPFATTTTLTAVKGDCEPGSPPYWSSPGPYCEYTLTVGVTDQNGSVPAGPIGVGVDSADGKFWGGMTVSSGTCTVYVTASWVLSRDCNSNSGSGLLSTATWALTASYGGTAGWSPSASATVVLAP